MVGGVHIWPRDVSISHSHTLVVDLEGIAPRAMREIFHRTRSIRESRVEIRCTMVELYLEKLYDKFQQQDPPPKLTITAEGNVRGLVRSRVNSSWLVSPRSNFKRIMFVTGRVGSLVARRNA